MVRSVVNSAGLTLEATNKPSAVTTRSLRSGWPFGQRNLKTPCIICALVTVRGWSETWMIAGGGERQD